MSKIAIPFIETKSGIPVIRCRVRNMLNPIYIVLDTGAELSTADSELGDSLDYSDEKYLYSVNGLTTKKEVEFIKAKADLHTIGAKDDLIILHAPLYVSKLPKINLESISGEQLPISIILGCDVLQYYNSKIDLTKKTWNVTL